MKRYIVLLVSMAVGIFSMSAVQTATATMKEVASKLQSGKSITAEFLASTAGSNALKGRIIVQGNKFYMESSSGNCTAFNGKTQWTLDPAAQEISIYEPTREEIAQINPFAILSGWQRLYKARLLENSATSRKIELIPQKGVCAPVKKAVVNINVTSKTPQSLEITAQDNSVVKIIISHLQLENNYPSSKFVINPKDFPSFDLVDLR